MRETKVVDFKSGDALVFNGGTEYDIKHGIDEIVKGSCPDFLLPDLEHERVSLQMRQSERNDNKWTRRPKKNNNAGASNSNAY